MTELTPGEKMAMQADVSREEAERILSGGGVGCGAVMACRLARTALASLARAEDAEAAVALVVERAEQTALTCASGADDDLRSVLARAIRALADMDGLAEVAKLRAERDDALAEVARAHEDRAYIIGANDGWDAAVEQGEASPAVGKAMVRFWKKLAETHNARAEKAESERDALAAKLAAAEARVGALTEALNEIDALDPEGMIDGCAQTALRGLVLRMGEIARAALTTPAEETKG